jgi:hypothetical protein
MPGLNIPTLVKVGALEQDTLNILNSAFGNTTSVLATVAQTAVPFGTFNTGAAVNFLTATPPAGVYRVTGYLLETTTFVTNTTTAITIGWTDESQAQTNIAFTTSTLTAGTFTSGSVTFRSSGSAQITWAPTKTGASATAGAASIYLVLERVL